MAKTWLAGADGCKGGWVVVLRESRSGEMVTRVVTDIEEVLRWDERPAVLCIDVPIGLLDRAVSGGRECDRAARTLLGQPRGRSVFSPPARAVLGAKSFTEALRLNRASAPGAPGISRQCYGILSKIREVDDLITPSLQDRVLEVHPELAFYELNHSASVAESKKSSDGYELRLRLLERAWKCTLSEMVEAHRRSTVARDDIVDAMAACWTAGRVLAGTSVRLPPEPPRDSRGLRMEIVR